jgi:hypothetical protein
VFTGQVEVFASDAVFKFVCGYRPIVCGDVKRIGSERKEGKIERKNKERECYLV